MNYRKGLLICFVAVVLSFSFLPASAKAEDVVIDWSHVSDMPGGTRYGMASAVIGDKVYLIGGRASHQSSSPSLDRIQVYDTTNNTWENKNSSLTLDGYPVDGYSWEEGVYSSSACVVYNEEKGYD